MTLAATGVVGIPMPRVRTPCTGEPTASATDQGPQQILMRAVVAASKSPIVGSFGLHRVKLLPADDGWHLGDQYPFLRLGIVVSAAHPPQRLLTGSCRMAAGSANIDHPGVRGIS